MKIQVTQWQEINTRIPVRVRNTAAKNQVRMQRRVNWANLKKGIAAIREEIAEQLNACANDELWSFRKQTI